MINNDGRDDKLNSFIFIFLPQDVRFLWREFLFASFLFFFIYFAFTLLFCCLIFAMLKKLYRIFAVPLFQDNYSYVVQGSKSNELVLVDPANPKVIIEFLQRNF